MADASRVPLGVILVRRDAGPVVHPGGKRQHTQLITWQRMKQVDGNVGSKLESDGRKKKRDKIMADGPRAIDFVENRGSKKSRLAESIPPHPSIHLLLLLLQWQY